MTLRKLGRRISPLTVEVLIDFCNLALANRVYSGRVSTTFPSPLTLTSTSK